MPQPRTSKDSSEQDHTYDDKQAPPDTPDIGMADRFLSIIRKDSHYLDWPNPKLTPDSKKGGIAAFGLNLGGMSLTVA